MKVITWMDLQGRFRITSPAYGHLIRKHSIRDEGGAVIQPFTEDDVITLVWRKVVAKGGYGITLDHPKFLVEGVDLSAKLTIIEGNRYRYRLVPNPDKLPGAWEMDADGTPKVNMIKAQALGL